jgi:hypothetical protein
MDYKYRLNTYCKDDITKIEKYDKALADNFKGWEIHHKLELTLAGEHACTKDDLIRMNMYYNRPYFELIFLTRSEHRQLHNNTNYYKKQMSKAKKGHAVSSITRNKIGNKHKGMLKDLTWKVINGKRVWLPKEVV